MQNKLALLICTFSFLSNCYALEDATCVRLTGSWYGAFWFKDPHDCHLNHGCKHSMVAEVTHIKDNQYRADVHPHVGREGTYMLSCINDKVTSADVSGSIMFTCIDKTMCQIKYDDDKLSANLLGAGV
jgi:hypothetical protein